MIDNEDTACHVVVVVVTHGGGRGYGLFLRNHNHMS